MKWVKYEEDMKVPIKSWCEEVSAKTMGQVKNASRHPAIFHHGAAMADLHYGYGVPIGFVMPCKDALIPKAVGSDGGWGINRKGNVDLGEAPPDLIRPLVKLKPLGVVKAVEGRK